LNKGIDIQTRSGQEVCASEDGVVDFVGTLPGYGTTIIVDHAGNISTVYAGPTTTLVTKGQQVPQGTVLAKTNSSGGEQKETLHFEVRNKHRPQNPLYYLK
jgi:murein DD-endopeptidase MepM/ murein hydrolase activator NlpD